MRAAVLAFVTTGCSFAFTSNPPPPCSASSVAPIADTAVATLAAIGAIYFLAEDETIGVAVESGLVLGFGAGAVTGFRRVGRCRAVLQ
jgi:hypothetical protein